MTRLALLACIPLLLLFAACGDDDDDQDENSGDGSGDTAQDGGTVTPTPNVIATVPPAEDGDVILTAGTADSPYTPTLAEFRQLPKTKIDADGEKEGVSLLELARQSGAPQDSTVTIQGTRPDGRVIQYVRESLGEIGEKSVLVVDEQGHLSLYSSALGKDKWLTNVLVVSFP